MDTAPHRPGRPVDPAPRLVVTGTIQACDVERVFELVDAATEADGVRPLSEHVTLPDDQPVGSGEPDTSRVKVDA